MTTLIKKIVELEYYDKDTLRDAIRILEELSDEGIEQEWMDRLASDLSDIVYRENWEVKEER